MSSLESNEKEKGKSPDKNPDKNPEIAAIIEALDEKRNIKFYCNSLIAIIAALAIILGFLFCLPLPDNNPSTTIPAITRTLDSLASKPMTEPKQLVETLKTLDHANTSLAIIVGAKILTALTLGIVLIIALSRIITTRYRTIATLYGIAKKK